MTIKNIILIFVFFLLATPAIAEPFQVAVDNAKILRLSRPAASVIIGNPAIADAIVHNGKMLFITGKTFGSTNFIAIDSDGKTIINRSLQVLPADNRLTLHRGGYQRSYLCGDGCEPVPGIGDDSEAFDRIMTQRKEKADEGTSAASE
ncbi:MAG: pilus assembly protein N-terminal domain-containing protein [Robiginitomaculum sp.]|nr:pilus assembly protein N-terminal domain-containing protein [Robiginitomaculum sp.]